MLLIMQEKYNTFFSGMYMSRINTFNGSDVAGRLQQGTQDFVLSFFFFFGCAILLVGSLLPDWGSNPGPLAVKALILTRWNARERPRKKKFFFKFSTASSSS